MANPIKKRNYSLVDAYNQMMARIRDVIERPQSHTAPSLQKAIDIARAEAIRHGEVTPGEADEIAAYIKRDVNDAAEYLMETSQEFSEWLMLDIDVIEQRVLELFLSVADSTRLELEAFARPKCETNDYMTGEITGPGTLQCAACGQTIGFRTTDHIPPCPTCGHDVYRRVER